MQLVILVQEFGKHVSLPCVCLTNSIEDLYSCESLLWAELAVIIISLQRKGHLQSNGQVDAALAQQNEQG